MSAVSFSVVEYGSFDYLEAVKLREEILRRPLGLTLLAEDLAAEAGDIFIVAKQCDQVVGCLVLTQKGDEEIRMRQVAVAAKQQGTGIGAGMVRLSEENARERGAYKIVLHAREKAVGFYERLGYVAEGEPFVEVGVLHRLMFKPLK